MRAAVIGAGIAGLNLARRLEELRIEVEVFEKARGASGRSSTRRTDSGSFDHGAQYFTARDPAFRRQLEDWEARGIAAEWHGRVVTLSACRSSAAEAGGKRFVGRPGMSGLARDLKGDREIHLGVRIERAERRADRWNLYSDAGFEYPDFDLLFVAVPAPQAVPLLREAPLLQAQAALVPMLACHAVMLSFTSDVEAEFDGAFVEAGAGGPVLSWAARDSSKPGRESESNWVLHSHPDWSRDHVELSAEEVTEALKADFERALGVGLPDLCFSATHRWLLARPAEPLSGEGCWDSASGVGICGDWLQGDRLEDAYVSAERLAEKVRASLARV